LTIACALAGLSLRADGSFVGGTAFGYLAPFLMKGCFILAILACPLLWARPDGLVPGPIAIPGRHRLMLALALIVGAPALLPWPF
jgi:hypothetical protein